MRRVLKWKGIVLAGLVGLLILAAGAVYAISEYRFSRSYDIQVEDE